MIKSLAAAIALTIGLTGYAVAREAAHRHHQHYRHSIQPPPPDPQLGPPPDANSIYWSPAGGNPVHYGQTTGFYGGR
jgi:hypothetical protein